MQHAALALLRQCCLHQVRSQVSLKSSIRTKCLFADMCEAVVALVRYADAVVVSLSFVSAQIHGVAALVEFQKLGLT